MNSPITGSIANISIIYEDNNFVVVNKPAGILSHSTSSKTFVDKNTEQTLVDFLRSRKDYCFLPIVDEASKEEIEYRRGIVHRLDRETTGLMVLAKNEKYEAIFKKLFKKRLLQKEYEALLEGNLYQGKGTLEFNLRRHNNHPLKRQVVSESDITHQQSSSKISKIAITEFQVIKRYANHTHVRIHPLTGRTHQIRVHFAHIGYPVLGDRLYSKSRGRLSDNGKIDKAFYLCATKISFTLPPVASQQTGVLQHFSINLPSFFQNKLNNSLTLV